MALETQHNLALKPPSPTDINTSLNIAHNHFYRDLAPRAREFLEEKFRTKVAPDLTIHGLEDYISEIYQDTLAHMVSFYTKNLSIKMRGKDIQAAAFRAIQRVAFREGEQSWWRAIYQEWHLTVRDLQQFPPISIRERTNFVKTRVFRELGDQIVTKAQDIYNRHLRSLRGQQPELRFAWAVFIARNYMGGDISISRIAEICGISPSNLYHLISELNIN